MIALQLQPPSVERIMEAQKDNPKFQKFRRHIEVAHRMDLNIHANGSL